MTFSFNALRAMIVTTHMQQIKTKGQVSSKDRVETDGQMDGGDCITSHANAVGKYAPNVSV